MKLYGDISKTEEQDDGTVKVWGYASTASVDSQGETVTADAMRNALPDYMKFANVREMHTAKAAGIAIEASVQDDGRTFFGAHIIDSEAVKKVRAGVYKGFSIGGKVLPGGRDATNPTIIKALRLSEVSLVDRPANPEATFTFFKADGLEGDDSKADDTTAPVTKADDDNSTTTVADELVTIKLSKADAEFIAGLDAAGITKMRDFLASEAAAADTLFKGMSHIGQLAYLLKELQYLTLDQINEAQREGDGSTVPAALTAAVKKLGDVLLQMTKEEVTELHGKIAAGLEGPGTSVQMADQGGDIAKAHGELTKALGAAGCPEGAVMADFVSKLAGERDTLTKRVAELEAMPTAPKGVLKTVEKADDINGGEPAKKEEAKKQTPEDIMKSVHATGAMVMTATGLRKLS